MTKNDSYNVSWGWISIWLCMQRFRPYYRAQFLTQLGLRRVECLGSGADARTRRGVVWKGQQSHVRWHHFFGRAPDDMIRCNCVACFHLLFKSWPFANWHSERCFVLFDPERPSENSNHKNTEILRHLILLAQYSEMKYTYWFYWVFLMTKYKIFANEKWISNLDNKQTPTVVAVVTSLVKPKGPLSH